MDGQPIQQPEWWWIEGYPPVHYLTEQTGLHSLGVAAILGMTAALFMLVIALSRSTHKR